MKKNRLIAVAAAASLSVSAMVSPVLAAETYHDFQKEALAAALDEQTAAFAESLENSTKALDGSAADMTIVLGDFAHMMISMFSGMDLSWLESATLKADVSLPTPEMIEKLVLCVNDSEIATVNFQMNMETMDILMQIPELSETFIKGNYMEMLDTSAEVMEQDAEELKAAFRMSLSLLSMLKNPPEVQQLNAIGQKYGDMIIDAFTDDGKSTETVEVGEFSKELTTYNAYIDVSALITLVNDFTSSVKADEDIKALFGENEEAYASLLEAISQIEASVGDVEPPADGEKENYIYHTVYADEDDRTVGWDISMVNADDTTAMRATAMNLTDGDETATNLYIESDNEPVFEIDGIGTADEAGLINGQYNVYLSGDDPIASISVEGYDPAAAAARGLKGKFTLEPVISEGTDGSANPLAGFAGIAITLDSDMDGVDGGTLDLDISMQGTSLGTLILSSRLSDGVAPIDAAAAVDAVDINDEKAMEEYGQNVNIFSLISSLIDAGMPESFLNSIFGMGGDTGITEEALPAEEPAASAPAEEASEAAPAEEAAEAAPAEEAAEAAPAEEAAEAAPAEEAAEPAPAEEAAEAAPADQPAA